MAEETKLSYEDLQKAYDVLTDQFNALHAEHQTLKADHEDLKVRFGLAKKAYVWKEGDSECKPVEIDGTCESCGWKWGDKEPHAVTAF